MTPLFCLDVCCESFMCVTYLCLQSDPWHTNPGMMEWCVCTYVHIHVTWHVRIVTWLAFLGVACLLTTSSQHTDTKSRVKQRSGVFASASPQLTVSHCNTLQRTATHCNTLQHTATHCNTPLNVATHCYSLWHAATHINTTHRCQNCLSCMSRWASAPAHCSTLQHNATHTNMTHKWKNARSCTSRWASAPTHYNTMQKTATHCNTHQYNTMSE